MNEYRATIKIQADVLRRWSFLLNQKRVDFKKEGFSENQVVFVKTAAFPDGKFADLKVCTSLNGGDIYSEVVIYDNNGKNIWLSDANNYLAGEWNLGGWINGEEVSYRLFVEELNEKSPFDQLNIERDDFCEMVRHELENGITSEYSENISEAISCSVAQNVVETADSDEWNTNDIRLSIGRILIEALKIQV